MNLPAASSRGIHADVIAPADSNLSSFVVREWLDVRNGAGSSIYILRCKQRGISPSLRNKTPACYPSPHSECVCLRKSGYSRK
jgi:hypothetical protein